MLPLKQNHKSFLAVAFLLVISVMLFGQARAAADMREESMANMPVKEITVFKDGHAFVLHEGKLPTDADGNVTIDYLPRPVIGTFWAYSADTGAKLTGVTSSKRTVSFKRTALTVPELIEGNIGARVRLRVRDEKTFDATILEIPTRSSEELGRTGSPGAPEVLPVRSDVVLLKVAEGVKVVALNQIQEVTFLDEPETAVACEDFRDIMTLRLDWGKREPEGTANVGMVYVQRGIRWIPNYRVDIDGKGKAVIKLQATVINELADVEDVTAHLVIGVPKFAFQDTPDPISLQQAAAQLSFHFRNDTQSAYAFSNMIMTQSVAPVRHVNVPPPDETIDLGPDIAESASNEDLYVFTLEHVTLKKGQRMVVPVAEYELSYRDVFVLDLPFAPPREVRQHFNSDQQARLAQLYHAPKVMHNIRLVNDAKFPLTTAPALILRQGRIIAQGMMTYTAPGASSNLELTNAVDISVEKLDTETIHTPDAARWDGYAYGRTDLTGTISLTSHRDEVLDLEVRRSVLGHIDEASNKGVIEHLGRNEGEWFAAGGLPFWWHWYNWPYWWYHFNAAGRITWQCQLKPGQAAELKYDWHYFWRQ